MLTLPSLGGQQVAKLDRALQRSILENLADVYPGIARIRASEGETQEDVDANTFYLAEHGLLTVPTTLMQNGKQSLGIPRITAAGMDFLADDGGLSAILGVVTVRLHDDTIRDLLIKRVEASDGEPGAKKALIDKIKGLPAEALGKLTMDGLDAALAQAPRLLELLGKLLG